MTLRSILSVSAAAALGAHAALVGAQTTSALSATPRAVPPPSQLAPPIAGQLSSESVRVTAKSGTTLDFWWVKALPVKPGTKAAGWGDVEEGVLIGAVQIGTEYTDIRGRIIKPGVYTLRYGLQPANGDHLGVSPFRDFLLLSPASADTDPAPTGHDGSIDLSKQSIGGSHPAVWSIDPPAATDPPLAHHTTELSHDAIIMEVPTTAGPKMKFGVVLVGKIEA